MPISYRDLRRMMDMTQALHFVRDSPIEIG